MFRHDYLNADMRIETTMETETQMVTEPRTYNSKGCGQPGEYIIAPPYFFLKEDAQNLYGDKGKLVDRDNRWRTYVLVTRLRCEEACLWLVLHVCRQLMIKTLCHFCRK